MQLEELKLTDLEFKVTPAVAAMRERARELKPKPLQLADMENVHAELTANRPYDTGQTYAEFNLCLTPLGPCHIVNKPGPIIINHFPSTKGALIEAEVISGLGDLYRNNPKIYDQISDNVLTHYPFEQYARERAHYLFADAVGLGLTYAPIFPVQSEKHKNFRLSGSLVLTTADRLVDLVIDGHHDPKWWMDDRVSRAGFAKLFEVCPKLWSLICADTPFRGFMGDANHNPGAYILTLDRDGQIAPYTTDGGRTGDFINKRRLLCEALNETRIMEKFTHREALALGAPERADMEIIKEVVDNICRLSDEKIREYVTAVEETAVHLVWGGKEVEVEDVCIKLKQSRDALVPTFNDWARQMNKITGLPLFTKLPELSGARLQTCQRPVAQQVRQPRRRPKNG